MRRIEQTGQFKRDLKKVSKGRYQSVLKTTFSEVVNLLARDTVLPEKYRDHALTGNWKDHRDCHLKPDLVLIYRVPDDVVLQLVRIGTHAQLSL